MKLKGHTTIQLTDVNTGKVDTYEDDNLVTNFANALFQPLGAVNTFNISSLNQTSPYMDFFGGILCLDTAIPSPSASEYYLPSGVGMTANACADSTVTGGNVTEMGTYNPTESGLSEDGKSYSFVYDWTTSQGNGTIASVCLTNPTFGYIGVGNKASGIRHSTTKSTSTYGGSYNTFKICGAGEELVSNFAWIDTKNNKIGVFRESLVTQLTNHSIVVDVYSYPFNKIEPMRSVTTDIATASNPKLLETLTYVISTGCPVQTSSYKDYIYRSYFKDKTAIIIRESNSTTRRDYVIELKPDGTHTEKWLTDSVTWGQSNTEAIAYNSKYVVEVYDGGASNIIISVYSIEDGTVTIYNKTITQPNNRDCLMTINDRIIGNGWEVADDGTVVYNNGSYGVGSYWQTMTGCAYGDEDILIADASHSYQYSNTNISHCPVLVRNQNWLSTINNLSTAIKKTNEQTMKITYTITEAD